MKKKNIIKLIICIAIIFLILISIFINKADKEVVTNNNKQSNIVMNNLDVSKWDTYFKASVEVTPIKDKLYYKIYFTQVLDDIILENLNMEYNVILNVKGIYKNGVEKEKRLTIKVNNIEKLEDKKYISKGEYKEENFDIKEVISDNEDILIYMKSLGADIYYK